MARVYISIGSNIEPLRYIRSSIRTLRQYYDKLILSSVYETEAVGFEGDNFYNLVVGFDTKMEVHKVVETLKQIENDNNRQRTSERFSARTLDLDLLLYDNFIVKDEILKYAFVIIPLAEIAPQSLHPITKQSYSDLAQAFDTSEQAIWRV
ncbi:2-amino-4-hydroxy-6-hydroxymethyldihydropteridine diphosphokinase [Candidatus Marithrix sp. Canyon 246]|uniref:2-amino-4-hydroxy-6- hydroxymethyldihydropteridine diphosphokinase n=1 Tax=Candidatus Marithrix sp. Canyon 246 TaxID=1827136 RepID=UPI00084A174F|nr:2-amino-4-hydroxy-6-hydroxymethyldihydropteridine diphosphokinase [Candidatus Marithrix sp. Canyon 246]